MCKIFILCESKLYGHCFLISLSPYTWNRRDSITNDRINHVLQTISRLVVLAVLYAISLSPNRVGHCLEQVQ